MTASTSAGTVLVLDDVPGGVALVPQPLTTPLTRLNFFDGRFLRGDDLTLEQQAMRGYVELSNQAGGAGVVNGLDLSLDAGPVLRLAAGLAIDPKGRVLLLPDAALPKLAELLDAAKGSAAPTSAKVVDGAVVPCEIAVSSGTTVTPVSGVDLYLVAAGQVQGLCGNAEVFGRLCDDACITATDRPYRIDGVSLLLLPLRLAAPLPTSSTITLTDVHLRSRVASAHFADEWTLGGSLLSAAGLATHVWCEGAVAFGGDVVPLGVLGLRAGAVLFLDEWTARRERMEAPPRRHWAGRMEMRPWPTFLAQVLQFQCQLAGLVISATTPETPDPGCVDEQLLLEESTKLVRQLSERLAAAEGGEASEHVEWQQRVKAMLAGKRRHRDDAHILVDGGVVELPPAGYLPVDPTSKVMLRDQVQDLLGTGVDLRFCAVRRDQIAGEFERAQHMNRISLLAGLDDPANRQDVDILVPGGLVGTTATTGTGYDVEVALGFAEASTETTGELTTILGEFTSAAAADPRRLPLSGAARVEAAPGFTMSVALSGAADASARRLLRLLARLGEQADFGAFRSAKVDSAPVTDADRRVILDAVNRALSVHRLTGGGRIVAVDDIGVDGNLLGLWLTFTLGADPFTMAERSTTTGTLTVQAVLPGKRPTVLDIRVDGDVQIRATRGDLVQREVQIQLTTYRSDASSNLGGAQPRPGPVPWALTLVRRRELGGERIEVRTGTSPAVLTLAWGGEPRVAELLIGERTGGASVATGVLRDSVGARIARALAVEDPTVGTAGNANHDAALAGLTVVQAANADDPTFLDNASGRLFPPASGVVTTITATTDWVLFRRRRHEDCGDAAVVAPPSQVTGWVATAKSAQEAEQWAAALRQGAGDKVPLRSFGPVEFQPGSAVLLTNADSVRSRYQNARGGDSILFAGYASNGDGGVGVTRAQSVADALSPTAELVGDVDVVADAPLGTVAAGTEGSVYLVSWREPEKEHDCVDVFYVDVDKAGNQRDDLIKAIQAGNGGLVDSLPDVVQQVGHLVVDTAAGALFDPAEIDSARAKIHDRFADNVELLAWASNAVSGSDHDEVKDRAIAAAKELAEALLREHQSAEVRDVVDADFQGGCTARVYVTRPLG